MRGNEGGGGFMEQAASSHIVYGQIHQRLEAEMADVQARFAAEVMSDLPCVNQLVSHVERYRGKMLRPMLVLVSGMAVTPESRLHAADSSDIRPSLATIAAVAEMIHIATLVHDDILDEAETRRQGATINHLSDNETAVMLGDYLISHAYHLCSSLKRPEISTAMARATNVVCEGELLQLANRNNWSLDEGTYYEIIKRKTASLCAVCCELGALLASGQRCDGLESYGLNLGIAFQVVDDLLDVTGETRTVGKTLGRDVQKGKLTLPAIHALAHGDASTKRELLALLEDHASLDRQKHGLEPAVVERLRNLLNRTGSVDYAYGQARRIIEQAKAGLAGLPNLAAVKLLSDAADAVVTRRA